MAWRAVVTNGGTALMQRWLDGGTMQITAAKGGTGRYEIEVLMQQTDVKGSKHALSITRYNVSKPVLPYWELYVGVQVRPEASAWTMTQIGLYAKLMDGETEVVGETLLAIYQAEEGSEVDVPSISTMADYVFEYEATLTTNTSDDLTVTIDPDAPITREDFNAAVEALVVPRVRTVQTITAGDWHAPGTTWTQDGRSFTAPSGMYACAVAVDGVTADSAIMDAWIDSGAEHIADEIEYETCNDGIIMLTSASAPGGSIAIGMMILV
jgi:hypothetical protein